MGRIVAKAWGTVYPCVNGWEGHQNPSQKQKARYRRRPNGLSSRAVVANYGHTQSTDFGWRFVGAKLVRSK
jgi:hypothetical protein